jgi:hypothetical protein
LTYIHITPFETKLQMKQKKHHTTSTQTTQKSSKRQGWCSKGGMVSFK